MFLDRDGVINAAVVRDGKPYPPASVAETKILDDVPEALSLLKAAGFGLAIVSNQPDVARGTQTREAVQAINSFLAARLPLDHFEICFHDESDDCDCRKPKPGLIYRSVLALGGTAETGFVVGDRWRDIEAGRTAGCRTVWIDRGYNEKSPTDYDYRADSLLMAARWIVAQEGDRR
ncbi:MAG: D-glycero-alpha-D-manno-heptose-1,7-bisphosphate 7-phosphatase [Terriglobia bacterium]